MAINTVKVARAVKIRSFSYILQKSFIYYVTPWRTFFAPIDRKKFSFYAYWK